MASGVATDERATAVRRFVRFYARRLAALGDGLAEGGFSPAEARVLTEIATRGGPTAAELARDLALDPGYLSRILRRFTAAGYLARTRSAADARASRLFLTPAGQAAFVPVDRHARDQAEALLAPLSDSDRHRVVAAMRTIEDLLGDGAANPAPFTLRPHRPGDIGWIVHRHGALYAQEYGWDDSFEALVAEIAASFIKTFDPKRERCWIAEKDGAIAGSVLLVKVTDEIAKLRLLYVEPHARGLGIGRRFVDECIRFSRDAGYRRVTLWTNDILHAARHIYAAAGFRLVKEEPHHSFSQDLMGEYWELEL